MNFRTQGRKMQSFHRVAVIALLSTGVPAVASAQAPAPQDKPLQQGAAAANRVAAAQLGALELTNDQKARIEAITARYSGATRAAMQGLATDREEGLKKLMALREKMLPEFRAVLTSAQREIFDRNMAELKTRMSPRP